MKSDHNTIDLKIFQIGTYQEWRLGIISRFVYRITENEFEINDTSNGWVSCIVDKETILGLTNGEKSFLELNWK